MNINTSKMGNQKANVYINKGAVLFKKNNIDRAISLFLSGYKLNSNSVEACFNLGYCYFLQKKYEKSIFYLRKTLKLNSSDPQAPNHLGMSLANLGGLMLYKEPKKALNYLLEADKYLPNNSKILYNIGNAYHAMGETEKSLETIEKVIQFDPEFEHTYGQYYMKLRHFARWGDAQKIFKKMKELSDKSLKLKQVTAETPYVSICNYQDPKRNFEIAKIWAKQDKDLVRDVEFKPKYIKKGANDKIRVGYLSYDYRDHATMHLILGVLRSHSKKKFKIYGYSYGPPNKSEYKSLAKKYVDVFRDIRLVTDVQAAEIINKDKIDILVDLKGHTSGCRLPIMALKPAPISITWLGFPGTVGADYIDYILTDKVVTLPSEAKYYSEKILYLPYTYQCTDNMQRISDRKFSRGAVGLPGDPDVIIFSSFNQTHKIEPSAFDSWMNILKKVPKSILWLFIDNKEAAENLKNEASKRGINTNRIYFAGPLPKNEHLSRIRLADIALDTFTYNGHTTTSDCLWAGVPVVTLKGNHFASRVSASLLTAIDLPELITTTQKEYEELAISLATNPKKLASVRKSLEANRLTKPLFDTIQFTKNLEKIYQKIYVKIYTGIK